MSWLPIVFVILVVLMMIVLGYYLIRSFLREYIYDVPSKTQSKCARYWKQDFGKYKEFIKK